MGHTSVENLKDLQDDLEKVRNLPGIKEMNPGIFYYKTIPFLHFHDKEGKRWADIKTSKGWKEIAIDFKPTKSTKLTFIKEVQRAHKRFTEL